ncbi:Uncharacterized protein LOCC1_G002237 [Lachnellula occidentalis]|uniref:Aminotransferase class I/classII large domain-containing protein n=1 Tax=Lachnellula occidentalis TaxID=215460 RepID=A0A8H8UGP1_9HELO|nr:Uncharacterized protein LOCC1_G002237 [Lachnellula occidentalis]
MGDFIDPHVRDKKPINLLRGWPHPSLLPTPAISTASQTVLSDPAISIPGLLYGPDPGYQPLREEIAKWLSRFYGGQADAERICVTGGASQNLACVLQVYSDPLFTSVWMVAPSYFLACRIFDDAGLVTRAVGEGDEGVDLEGLEARLKEAERDEGVKKIKLVKPWSKIYRHIIYCVPTSQTLQARPYDVYDFLLWPTSSSSSTTSTTALMPRLADVDRTMEPVPSADSFGNAMSNGSFSKIAGPGLRTGWADATPTFTYGLSQCGSSRSGGAPSQFTATLVCELLKSGDVGKHIEKVLIPAYKKRYEIMMKAIKQFLIPVGVKVGEVSFGEKEIFGGFFIWIELPPTMSAEVVCSTAKERENLIVAPGRLFEVSGDSSVKFETSLRLCFAWEEVEGLEDGVRRLGKVIREVGEGKSTPSRHAGKDIKNDLGEFR